MIKAVQSKRVLRRSLVFIVILLTMGMADLAACEIFFEVIENEKKIYKTKREL